MSRSAPAITAGSPPLSGPSKPWRAARWRLRASTSDIEAPLRAIGDHSAVGRIGRPDEFAAVAAFLASERASYVTGGVHLLDGGASVLGHPVTQYTSVPKDTYT